MVIYVMSNYAFMCTIHKLDIFHTLITLITKMTSLCFSLAIKISIINKIYLHQLYSTN